jgi:hypothetical protein
MVFDDSVSNVTVRSYISSRSLHRLAQLGTKLYLTAHFLSGPFARINELFL